MTINQLRYVVEVAKASSINRAAANLFVSQSVVSTAITSLEKEIGHIIFVRSNRGVSLTPFGHTFISYVSSIQAQLQQLDSLIQRDFVQHEFHLSVASSGYYFLSRICAELFERYRSMGIRVEQYEDHENNVADLVDSQIAEIGIVKHLAAFFRSRDNLESLGLQLFQRVADRSDPANGNRRQCTGRRTNRFRIDGCRIFQRCNQSMRAGALSRTGNRSEIADIGHTVEYYDQRRFVVGHPLQNIGQLNIGDSSGLRDYALMIAADQPVQFFHGHFLPTQPMPRAKVFQLLHQLTVGPLADVEFFDLPSGFDGLGHGPNAENKIIVHIILWFPCFDFYAVEQLQKSIIVFEKIDCSVFSQPTVYLPVDMIA